MGIKTDIRDVSDISKLTTEGDWQHWKFQIEILFAVNELGGFVEGSETLSAATALGAAQAEDWKKRNDKARMYMCAAIDKKMLKKLINCQTAKDMWSRLGSLYERHAAEN